MRLFALSLLVVLGVACAVPGAATPAATVPPTPPPTRPVATERAPADALPTALPTRVRWQFGELLPYDTQSGDTLAVIALHFNTTPEAIRQANPEFAHDDLTILPPGMPLSIPAHYAPLSGTPFKIIPDSELVYGPAQSSFSLKATILEHNGFLSRYAEYAEEKMRPSWEIIERVARDYSINPRLLLALVEHQSGALTQAGVPDFTYPLGHQNLSRTGLHKQLIWAAEILSEGYYGWRYGHLLTTTATDGKLQRIDFWQNAGTAALHQLFAQLMPSDEFQVAVGPKGLAATYHRLFGDPFKHDVHLFPAFTEQPALELPFQPGRVWSFTGGPHPAWGEKTPWAALDFAPPAVGLGCGFSNEPVAAMADGLIVRSGEAAVVLDLDSDGNEHTGWVIFYYHMKQDALPPVGRAVSVGDPLGYGSCDGGAATGTHVHVARRFNGEWIPTRGPLPFVMSGWLANEGNSPYLGSLTLEYPAMKINACICVTASNQLSR